MKYTREDQSCDDQARSIMKSDQELINNQSLGGSFILDMNKTLSYSWNDHCLTAGIHHQVLTQTS